MRSLSPIIVRFRAALLIKLEPVMQRKLSTTIYRQGLCPQMDFSSRLVSLLYDFCRFSANQSLFLFCYLIHWFKLKRTSCKGNLVSNKKVYPNMFLKNIGQNWMHDFQNYFKLPRGKVEFIYQKMGPYIFSVHVYCHRKGSIWTNYKRACIFVGEKSHFSRRNKKRNDNNLGYELSEQST